MQSIPLGQSNKDGRQREDSTLGPRRLTKRGAFRLEDKGSGGENASSGIYHPGCFRCFSCLWSGLQLLRSCLEAFTPRNAPFTTVHLLHSTLRHSICSANISFPFFAWRRAGNREPRDSFFPTSVSAQITSKHNGASSISHVPAIKLPPPCLTRGLERSLDGSGPPANGFYPAVNSPYSHIRRNHLIWDLYLIYFICPMSFASHLQRRLW